LRRHQFSSIQIALLFHKAIFGGLDNWVEIMPKHSVKISCPEPYYLKLDTSA
jgi:hypothetical protein